jgi:hypothetical protein
MRVVRPWALLIACTLTLASCAGDGPAGPSGSNPPVSGNGNSPNDTTGTPSDTTGVPSDTTGTPADTSATPSGPSEDSLQALLHAEQARIAATRIASIAAHDSLNIIWVLSQSLPLPGLPSPLLLCRPLDYDGEAAIIGPEGGELRFGPHRLTIPAGALLTRTVVTAEAPTSLMVTADFSPHGLQFQKDVELRLDYDHCTQPLLPGAFRVVYLDDLLRILETPPSEDYRSSRWIRGWLRHFSKYAVAY